MSSICYACAQPIRQAHKEMLSKSKLNMLRQAAEHVKLTMVNEVPLSLLRGNANHYNNFQKLRYHGLIARTKAGKGNWLITRNGWSFLRGETSLPKYVLIKNNHIQSRADQLVSIKDIFYGDPTMYTTFEYFDDNGRAVGYRPTYAPTQTSQASLL